MFGLSAGHLILLLLIVLLLFGTNKLRNLGSDLGSAIKGFRNALSPEPTDEQRRQPPTAEKIIEGEVERGRKSP